MPKSSVESIPLLSRPAEHLAVIELNRPESANRIQPEDLQELERLLQVCEEDGGIHAGVLTARGPFFSAGFDLRALVANLSDTDAEAVGESAFEAVANRLETARPIVIAAINGPVLGGATDLALACDLRIGSSGIHMQMPAARFGLPLYAGALQRYVTRLGLNAAKRLVFLAEKVEAADMLAIGFLTELVEAEDVRPRALALAGAIASMPAKPLAAMKQVLNAAATGREAVEETRDVLHAALDGPAIARRINALRSKPSPQ